MMRGISGFMAGSHPTLLDPGLMHWLASVALRGAWESLLIAGFLSFLLRRMPHLSPRAAFRGWGIGFALAALLPVCRSGAERIPTAASKVPYASSGFQGIGAEVHRVLPFVASPVISLSSRWAVALCALWAGASAIAFVRFMAGAWSLWRLLQEANPAPPALEATYRALMAADGQAAGRGGGARLLISDGVVAPSACGLFGACIVLPRELVESLSLEEMAGVLRHEAAHLRRRDDWFIVAARLVQAALPLAVAMPYLERRMAWAREMACDDAALRPGVSRRRYAACLARLAENAGARQWRGLAPRFGGDGSQLAVRVGHILHGGEPFHRLCRTKLAAAGFAVVLMSVALLGAPAFFSFTSGDQTASVIEPELAGIRPTAMLPMEKMRPIPWNVSGVQHSRRPSKLEVGASREKRPSFLWAETAAPVPQAVLVVWAARQDCIEDDLILIVASPRGGPAHNAPPVFLLTI